VELDSIDYITTEGYSVFGSLGLTRASSRRAKGAPLRLGVSLANVITITELLVDPERELEETGLPV